MRRSNARRTVSPNSTQNGDVLKQNSEEMDSIKLQYRPNNRRNANKQLNHRSNFIFYILVSFFVLFFCYLLLFSKNKYSNLNFVKYGIVIDGGSTGTRMHVFRYEVVDGEERKRAVYDFSEGGLVSMRVHPGLSAFEKEPERAGETLEKLVEFGKEKVPKEYWRDTEIKLMATAGMRLLEENVQDRILEVCRGVLRVSGFKFRDDWVSVISGSDEGLYAWVVANYALGTLGEDSQQTTGIVELGGASAQVTFVANEPMPPEYTRSVRYGKKTYNLYSHSLLQYGQNVAFDLVRESFISNRRELATESLQSEKPVDPCTPRGYAHDQELWKLSPSSLAEKSRYLSSLLPSGNFSECRSASLTLLQKDKERCTYQNCFIGSTFMPKLQGKFLATENFFHTSKFFGLTQKAFLSDLVVAGQQFCEDDWSKLKHKYHSLEEEDLRRYCFSSAYIVALLHDSLGISLDDERIAYANQVQNIPLDWALGAFIMQTADELDSKSTGTIIQHNFTTSVVLFGILFVVIVAWTVSKWKKPQLKTIYDLEKGKYIITRVGRNS